MPRFLALSLVVAFFGYIPASALAQSVRDHTRLKNNRPTTVSADQATELTLTVTDVAVRPIQVWIRIAGTIDAARKIITADVPAGQAARIRAGQRVRAFSPESRSRMHQATVSQVSHRDAVSPAKPVVSLKATLMGQPPETGRHYILEVVTEDGDFLSVPNEAIIETGKETGGETGERAALVYVRAADGEYAQREVKLGVQGELFTQVLEGLKAGEQVVTIGSFFIDADQKLKGS
jgi:membrane fusion protein, copper/silver efflux system